MSKGFVKAMGNSYQFVTVTECRTRSAIVFQTAWIKRDTLVVHSLLISNAQKCFVTAQHG